MTSGPRMPRMEYAERFAEIVEHRDGHNTDRLLKELADKGVLNK